MLSKKADLIGEQFGDLLVSDFLGKNQKNQRLWICTCKCGKTRTVKSSDLIAKKATHCGCRSISFLDKKSFNDLTNRRFGYLIALKFLCREKGRNVWECKCDCGKILSVSQKSLISKMRTSCGCKKGLKHIKDIVGQKFGKLLVVEYVGRYGGKGSEWLCKCDCGNNIKVSRSNLGRGTKSCGCIKIEMLKNPKRTNNVPRCGEAALRKLIREYKYGAYSRGLEYNLTQEEFKNVCSQNCFYCGSIPLSVKKTYYNEENMIYNGIDRIDNEIGYFINNIIPCCKICNRARSNMGQKEFIEWIKKVYIHLISKNL